MALSGWLQNNEKEKKERMDRIKEKIKREINREGGRVPGEVPPHCATADFNAAISPRGLAIMRPI